MISARAYILFSKLPGKTIYLKFPWGTYVTEKTLLYIAIVYTRFLIACIANLIFLCTTREADIKSVFDFFHAPYLVTFIFVFSLRIMSILLTDWWNIVQAQRARGMDFEGSLSQKLKRLKELLLPMMVGVLTRMEQLNQAIIARGFLTPGVKRTQVRKIG